ncbi:MAG TPA: acyl carrier protein [Lutibacter sp.]|nr:acyl carrier protein [Lutibacter sp.]
MEQYIMSDEEVLVEVKKVLMEEFEVEESVITLEANFYEDLGLDSLDAIDLIVTLNNFYNIEVEPTESEEIRTVQNLIEIVKKHKQ